MYSEILDFHNIDNIDGVNYLGTPLTGMGFEGQDVEYVQPQQ
jgi:p38 MAP kinase